MKWICGMIDFRGFEQRSRLLTAELPLGKKVTEWHVDGLFLRSYEPENAVEDVVLIYHGGGVNMDAGYNILARQLIQCASTCVVLTDLRGHGRSTGNRGDAAAPRQIWRDVDTVLESVSTRFPAANVHLLGHSSGAGMLINYFTRHAPRAKSASLLLIAPELGPFAPAQVRNQDAMPFATVIQWPFVANALSGGLLFRHYPAVALHFPTEVRHRKTDFIERYSVALANALTPRHPQPQLAALPCPVTILVAEKDELYDADRLAEIISRCGSHIRCQRIADSTHLDCLFNSSKHIAQHIHWVRTARGR